ncbi:hypothetical protein Tco_0689299 [Tanacetum coccineum]
MMIRLELDDDMGYDSSDVAFIEWLASKNFNYKTTDHYTMKALWIYLIIGDDEVELTDETPLWFKTYEDYKDDWIYKWNKDVPWVYDKPWINNGIWKEPTPDYEWYEPLEDCELKNKALRNKAIMEGFIKDDDDESHFEQMK